MLSGQVVDGFATIFSGELIDGFGHFNLWHSGGSVLTIGYSIFAAIFNVGWAAAQVSHMSMVNCLTSNSTSRVALATCHNAFTMVANLGLYAIVWQSSYRWISYVAIFIGCCFIVIFLVGTKEPQLVQHLHCQVKQKIPWTYWFKKVLYYQVALVYMLTRLVTNVSQALLAFYVINDLEMSQFSKAL